MRGWFFKLSVFLQAARELSKEREQQDYIAWIKAVEQKKAELKGRLDETTKQGREGAICEICKRFYLKGKQ